MSKHSVGDRSVGEGGADGESRVDYTIVVPVYNEEDVIPESYRRLSAVMDSYEGLWELIFVNDGSGDRTASLLSEIEAKDLRVMVLEFSRNFGHQAAISAGMDYARGAAIAIIDADLQDPPELIPKMLDVWREGWDVVYGKRVRRKGETIFKKASASLFYRFLRSMTSVDIPTDTGDFRVIDRSVCEVLSGLREKNRFIRGLVSWAGYRSFPFEYEREERYAGTTKYPLSKMIRFALDAVTGFSHKPLRIASWIGFFLSLASFVYLIVILVQRLVFSDSTIPGWASITAISLFFNGIVLVILGIIGEYVGRIYDEAKNRPLYVIKKPRRASGRPDRNPDRGPDRGTRGPKR